MTSTGFAAGLVLLVASIGSGWGHEYVVHDIRIIHPYAAPTVPAQANGAVYFSLENNSKNAVRLVRASTAVASGAELHQMSMHGNVAKMRAVSAVNVKVGETIRMAPAQGYHLMLVNLRQPLKEGDKFPLILEFDRIGKVEVSVLVQKPQQGAPATVEHHH